MNAAIIIPTYWTRDASETSDYDHATSIHNPHPELERLLTSLDSCAGFARIFIVLSAEREIEQEARARIDAIARAHPALTICVIGVAEARAVQNRVLALAPHLTGECISLRGYGAIKNMGLVVASVFNHSAVVFLDDDEVVTDDQFAQKALYGLGQYTRQNLPIYAKSGYYVDGDNSYLAQEKVPFYDRYWSQAKAFNTWMRQAQVSARISRTNYLCGGLMAFHAEAYTRVPFDPFITRGDDQDYLFNLRLHNILVWFDNQWSVAHLPPETTDSTKRFEQNAYRWVYEREKLKSMGARLDFQQVSPASLMPYPGVCMDKDLKKRIQKTAWLRALAMRDKGAYLRFAWRGYDDALMSAKALSSSYLAFQTSWPSLTKVLWADQSLQQSLMQLQTEKAHHA